MANKKSKKRKKKGSRLPVILLISAVAIAAAVLPFVLGRGYELENESDPVATITLSDGKRVIIELYADKAPISVANFTELANSGFYDGMSFHRVIAGERVQAGDNTGDGLGNAGYAIRGEFALNGYTNDLSHTRGALSMARLDGYDSASSQFFICVGDLSYVDGAYAAFGRVVKGMEWIDKIAAAATDENNKPLEEYIIKSIRVDAKEFSYDFEKLPN